MYTIVLVDDDQVYRETLTEALQFEGYHVIPAENGAVALSLMQQGKPDAILSNGNMPVLTGIELLQAVKADEQLQTIPFILITGEREDGLAKVARDLGADAVVLKPILLDDLYALLRNFLQQPKTRKSGAMD